MLVVALLTLSCSGNGEADRERRPEAGGEANNVMTKRYEQVYANPGLNSGVTAAATATGADATKFRYNDTDIPGGARTLLAVDHRRVLVDFGDVFFAVNLPHQKTLGFHLKSTHTFLRLTEAGTFVYVNNFQLVRTTFDRFKEPVAEDFFVPGLGEYSELYCLLPAESTFLAGVQDLGHPHDIKKSFALFSKQYPELSTLWKIDINGVVVRPPLSSKGTAALAYPGTVALVGADGARRDIDSGEFRPISASFGPDDALYVLMTLDSGVVLRAYSPTGEQLWTMPSPVTDPTQPPVVGKDGTIYLLQTGTVAAIRNQEVAWQDSLIGEVPVATVEGSGKLLVSAGVKVICFDTDGEQVWAYDDPDNEVWRTPPVVLDNGAVVAASDKSIVVIK